MDRAGWGRKEAMWVKFDLEVEYGLGVMMLVENGGLIWYSGKLEANECMCGCVFLNNNWNISMWKLDKATHSDWIWSLYFM